ncbi:DNA polymerase III subunit gamma/tau [Buchnera aphidicola]|uniref:DNA polymerase III subunit gamma/tau n=1 Tax=Buchnera aphidicola subsp. Melaphis rhois TaxID=118103 RepID=A0A4D6Y1F4_BUCMH|nr:DNA polymerase III subunit gamma/tau [Buchnera aphidicola]QCI23442.1 DNA polymerase III subunit gamma/tau [Buchnera aphidicola (Melaphis rhois)]
MNYQILANKWRPKTFSHVIGQKYIITAIRNGLKLGRIHHTWLFHGIQGTGKTTISRLLAKSLNCKIGITHAPCRTCSNCKDIEQGKFIDLFEIDAATRTKVEDMKELLDNINYLPSQGRFKVYIIDEIHMLSKHSFNSLLKIIEEPPKHIKFILATTNIEKVPKTILSRCLHFKLTSIHHNEILIRIKHILSQENIKFENQAIKLLSIESQGSLRDALNLTEQAISMGNEQVSTKIVEKMLRRLNSSQIIKIIVALLQKDHKTILSLLEYINTIDINWEHILIEILKSLYQIAMFKTFPEINKNNLFFENEEENEIMCKISKISKYIDIQSYYKTMLIGRKELNIAPSYQIGVEMTLLRALNLDTTPIKINISNNT